MVHKFSIKLMTYANCVKQDTKMVENIRNNIHTERRGNRKRAQQKCMTEQKIGT
jgi:hypothetical protein